MPIGSSIGNRKFYRTVLLVLIFSSIIGGLVSRFILDSKLGGLEELLEAGIYSPEAIQIGRGRVELYTRALEAFWDNPLRGIGYMAWNHPSNSYNPFARYDSALSVHSFHLQALAETGIIGFLLYETLLIRLLMQGWHWLRKFPVTPRDVRVYVGCMVFCTSLLFLVGGLFDNHGFQYRHLFFATGLSTIFLGRVPANESERWS
jgi:O-antigen ligase